MQAPGMQTEWVSSMSVASRAGGTLPLHAAASADFSSVLSEMAQRAGVLSASAKDQGLPGAVDQNAVPKAPPGARALPASDAEETAAARTPDPISATDAIVDGLTKASTTNSTDSAVGLGLYGTGRSISSVLGSQRSPEPVAGAMPPVTTAEAVAWMKEDESSPATSPAEGTENAAPEKLSGLKRSKAMAASQPAAKKETRSPRLSGAVPTDAKPPVASSDVLQQVNTGNRSPVPVAAAVPVDAAPDRTSHVRVSSAVSAHADSVAAVQVTGSAGGNVTRSGAGRGDATGLTTLTNAGGKSQVPTAAPASSAETPGKAARVDSSPVTESRSGRAAAHHPEPAGSPQASSVASPNAAAAASARSTAAISFAPPSAHHSDPSPAGSAAQAAAAAPLHSVGGAVQAVAAAAHSAENTGRIGAAFDKMDAASAPHLIAGSPQQVTVGVRDSGLGWVEIHASTAGGQVSTVLGASSAAAHTILSAHIPEVREYLAGQQIHVDHLASQDFSASQDGRGGSARDQPQPQSSPGTLRVGQDISNLPLHETAESDDLNIINIRA